MRQTRLRKDNAGFIDDTSRIALVFCQCEVHTVLARPFMPVIFFIDDAYPFVPEEKEVCRERSSLSPLQIHVKYTINKIF